MVVPAASTVVWAESAGEPGGEHAAISATSPTASTRRFTCCCRGRPWRRHCRDAFFRSYGYRQAQPAPAGGRGAVAARGSHRDRRAALLPRPRLPARGVGARRSLARPRRDGRGDAGGSRHRGGDHPAHRGDAPDGHHRLPRVARAPLPGRVEPAQTASQDDGEAVAAAQGDRDRHRRPTQRRHRQRCGGESAWGRPGYRRVLGPHHGRLARRGVAPRGQGRSASRGVRRPSASPARCHGHRRGRGAAPGGVGWCARPGHGGR